MSFTSFFLTSSAITNETLRRKVCEKVERSYPFYCTGPLHSEVNDFSRSLARYVWYAWYSWCAQCVSIPGMLLRLPFIRTLRQDPFDANIYQHRISWFNLELDHWVMQFQTFDWLSGHGISTTNTEKMAAVKLCSGRSCKSVRF